MFVEPAVDRVAHSLEVHAGMPEARDAVLAAARRTFATQGFERTTVRAVAASAGVDASMVIRYFTSKDGLFQAATAIDLALPDLQRVPAPERGRVLAERFVALWDDPATGEVLTLLLRSAPTSERAKERVREVFATQVRVRRGVSSWRGERRPGRRALNHGQSACGPFGRRGLASKGESE